MNDLAQEASISRQTLYNAYSNKDEVLCALIRSFADGAKAEIEAGFEQTDDLGKRLDLVFDRVAITSYDQLMQSPNSADIIEGFNTISRDEIDASYAELRDLIGEILAPMPVQPRRQG